MHGRMSGGVALPGERLSFLERGYSICRNVFEDGELTAIAAEFVDGKPGDRRFDLSGSLRETIFSGQLPALAAEFSGNVVRPTRLILFDKSVDNNWALGWHQDRTIAVADRADVKGYDVWSKKAGEWHVEPPVELMEKMITLRLSLDPSNAENGALEVIPGSHKFGRLNNAQTNELVEAGASELLSTGAGDVVILSTLILHRSKPSVSNSRRRVVQVDYTWGELPSPLAWALNK